MLERYINEKKQFPQLEWKNADILDIKVMEDLLTNNAEFYDLIIINAEEQLELPILKLSYYLLKSKGRILVILSSDFFQKENNKIFYLNLKLCIQKEYKLGFLSYLIQDPETKEKADSLFELTKELNENPLEWISEVIK